MTGDSAPNEVVLHDLTSGVERTLLWEPYLFPQRGSFNETTRFALLGEKELVFDTFRRAQPLYELDLSTDALRTVREGIATDRQPAYSPDRGRILLTSNAAATSRSGWQTPTAPTRGGYRATASTPKTPR
ncbi:MAG: hypothetical protein PVJ51_14375 [Acidobacteriota bacterium]